MILVANNQGIVGIFKDEADLTDYLSNDPEGAKIDETSIGWTPFGMPGSAFSNKIKRSRRISAQTGAFETGPKRIHSGTQKAKRRALIAARQAKKDGDLPADAIIDTLDAIPEKILVKAGVEVMSEAEALPRTAKNVRAEKMNAQVVAKKASQRSEDEDALAELDDLIDSGADAKTIATKTKKSILQLALGEEPSTTKENRLELARRLVGETEEEPEAENA